MRTRNRHVSVWLTDKEYAHLKAQAQRAGLGIDPFVRTLIAGVQLRPRPPDAYAALLRELSAIGNNVNQIAHNTNAKKKRRPGRHRRGREAGPAGVAIGEGDAVMAYTKIKVVDSRLDRCLDYVQNHEKTSLANELDYAMNRDKTEGPRS